jgi:hypothetical protein
VVDPSANNMFQFSVESVIGKVFGAPPRKWAQGGRAVVITSVRVRRGSTAGAVKSALGPVLTGSQARRAANIMTIFLVAHLFAGCGPQPETPALPPGPAPLAIRLDYLQSLGLDAVVRGRPVRVVALYAEAPFILTRPTGM